MSSGAEYYISRLENAALRHRAVNHPYLRALIDGSLPQHRQALIDLSEQLSSYSLSKIDLLKSLEDSLVAVEARESIRLNIVRAMGLYDLDTLQVLAGQGLDTTLVDGMPQHELFMDLTQALGGRHRQPGFPIRLWRNSLLALSSCPGGQEGLGALGLGSAMIDPLLYKVLHQTTHFIPHLSRADKTLLELNTHLPNPYVTIFRGPLVEMAQLPSNRPRIAHGMFEALELRACVWDWLYERASLRLDQVAL